MIKINRNGEMEFNQNEVSYFATVSNFKRPTVTAEDLSDSYEKMLDELNYSDSVAHVVNIRAVGKYIYFDYVQNETSSFQTIRSFPFEKQMQFFRSLVDIGKLQKEKGTQILWKTDNFLISHEEGNERIKAILHSFGDFKVYDNTDEFVGVRKIILSALTKLNNITGKPNRADFINKSDEVISFAEELFTSNDLNDIELVIQAKLDEFERQREEREEEERLKLEEKSNKKGKFFNKKKPKLKEDTPKRLSSKEYLKQNLNKSVDSNSDKPKKKFSLTNIKKWLFSSPLNMGIFIVALLVMFLLVNTIASNSSGKSEDEKQLKQERKVKNETLNVYQEYINGNKKKAHDKFANMKYNELPTKEDKKIYVKWLIEDEKYTRALKLDNDVAYELGNKINKDNIDDIKKINGNNSNKVLTFFIASYDKDFQTQIDLANDVNLKDENVANKLAQAYTLSNQEDEFESFIKKKEKELDSDDKALKNLHSTKQYYSNEKMEYEDDKKEMDKAKKEVSEKSKAVDKAKSKDKSKAKDELKNAREQLKSAEDKYDESYNEILNTTSNEAIEN
ncbi:MULTISPECIES: hypothetical protein [Staphylococcus]|uniref:hypothetical protein n=1 Tax=Staphylococcus TaxID=1279 RepID=UPI00194E165B|nr:hypothetical protein [Staphylococcus xylosus]MBM6639460.1 hypothetical protein [Staphylococcus xylosus]